MTNDNLLIQCSLVCSFSNLSLFDFSSLWSRFAVFWVILINADKPLKVHEIYKTDFEFFLSKKMTLGLWFWNLAEFEIYFEINALIKLFINVWNIPWISFSSHLLYLEFWETSASIFFWYLSTFLSISAVFSLIIWSCLFKFSSKSSSLPWKSR